MKKEDWTSGLFDKKHVEKLRTRTKETYGPTLDESAKFQNAPPGLRSKMKAAARQRKLRRIHDIWNPE